MNKIYITGSVGSGKTTLAKKLSLKNNIPYYELDHIAHKRLHENKRGNIKREENERNLMFSNIINSDKWIIEDGLRGYFKKGLDKADTIIFLDIPLTLIRFRIITRWVKQILHLEECLYKSNISMLIWLLKESRKFYNNKKVFIDILNEYEDKLIILNQRSVKAFLNNN